MKIIFSVLVFAFFLLLISCTKESNKSVTVIKDCTGTYLRMNKKDYRVCNFEKLNSFKDMASITATFRKIENCPSADSSIVCDMFHQYEGWVEVVEVK